MVVIPSCAAGVPIFQLLPADGLTELGDAMRHQHYSKGELLVSAGEPVAHLIVVARGRLKLVHTSSSGREQVVRTLEPGEFLGEMGLFAHARHEGDLIASADSDACLVPRDAIQQILRRHPDVALRLVEALAQRLAEAEQTIAGLGLRDVGGRLAAELVRMAAGVKAMPDGSIVVRPDGPWAELAIRLGTTPESLSRRLRALCEQGIIAQPEPRTVIIRRLDRLERIAEA
ncbi:MAG TPA: Crp/Fnr family transcriptional regulator [Symbiobacteriaceae bacterium]|jgi:CRP/FNR family transcriptional regulator